MNIQQRKLSIIEAFLKVESEEIISEFENFLNIVPDDTETKVIPFTEEEYVNRIKESMNDYENGRVTAHQDVISSLQK